MTEHTQSTEQPTNNFRTFTRRNSLKALGAAGVVSLAGCTGAFSEGSEWDQTIGVLMPQTGPLAGIGSQAEQAVEIAFDDVNERLDLDLDFQIEDTEGDSEQARNAARTLIENGAPVLAGMVSSDSALAIRDISESDSIPILNSYANNDDVTQEGTEYTYRYIGNSTQEMKGTMEFWENEGVSTVALIAADYSFGRSVGEAMETLAGDFGQSVSKISYLPVTTNNFEPELRNLDQNELDAIFIAFPGENGPVLVQQLAEEGFLEETIVTGNYSYSTNVMLQVVGDQLPGLTAWGVDKTAASGLQSEFADRYDTRMDSLHALPYETFSVVAEAMAAAESIGPDAINDALGGIEHEGTVGIPAEFGDQGHNVGYRQLVTEWQTTDDGLNDPVIYQTDTLPP